MPGLGDVLCWDARGSDSHLLQHCESQALKLQRGKVKDEMFRKAFACSYICGMGSQKQHF